MYKVISQFESADGGSAWDTEEFGPFENLAEAQKCANAHSNDCSSEPAIEGKGKHIVEIFDNYKRIERVSERLYD